MDTQKLKMNIAKILSEYICTVEKLYGTPLKAFLNFVMVVGFYFVSDVAIVASGSIVYNIYHVRISPFHIFILNTIFHLISYVILFQLLSISLGFMFWFGGVTYKYNKKTKR